MWAEGTEHTRAVPWEPNTGVTHSFQPPSLRCSRDGPCYLQDEQRIHSLIRVTWRGLRIDEPREAKYQGEKHVCRGMWRGVQTRKPMSAQVKLR